MCASQTRLFPRQWALCCKTARCGYSDDEIKNIDFNRPFQKRGCPIRDILFFQSEGIRKADLGGPLPQQAVVLKPRRNQPLVARVADVGTHRSADQHKLVKVHHKSIGGERLPDYLIEGAGPSAKVKHPFGDLSHLGAVFRDDRVDIPHSGACAGRKSFASSVSTQLSFRGRRARRR